MLEEVRITGLGVIDDALLELSPGFTALTGETGAGKTMLVEALELLVGGKADTALVRPGADEATIEGRFVLDDEEIVLSRVVPAVGRSRAYVNSRIAPASSLAEWGTRLVDLHGQHEHQSLLSPAVQRHALDLFGSVDLTTLLDAKRDQIFTARFESIEQRWVEQEAPHLDTLAAMLSRSPRPIHLVGEGILFHQQHIPSGADDIVITKPEVWRARASVVAAIGAEMARAGEFVDPFVLEPIYVRIPEAQEKLEKQSL